MYDYNVVHTPTTITPFSQGQDVNFDIEELSSSEQNAAHEILEVELREAGFHGRVWTMSSFSTMQQHSQTNFLCGMEKIIEHVIKTLAPFDFKDVHRALNERWNQKTREKFEKNYG